MYQEEKPVLDPLVAKLQVKIDILKWIKSAKTVVPGLPDSIIKKNLELSLENLLNCETDLASEMQALRHTNEKLTKELQESEQRYSDLKSEQPLANNPQFDKGSLWGTRIKWFICGLIVLNIVQYLQSHLG